MSNTLNSKKISILIADDHQVVRDGLRARLEKLGHYQVLPDAADGITALALCRQHRPNIVLLDAQMPGMSGLDVCAEIKRRCPATRVVFFTGQTQRQTLLPLVNAGAAGVFLKSDDFEQVLLALPEILQGTATLSASVRELAGSDDDSGLTKREAQVLRLITLGHTNREIAELLHISAKTVDRHRTNLMRKLQVHSVSELMRRSFELGLID
ncbi:response regulator transcription factor [Exilibacterium tricleocarpae]|uniref:Response regulator transcription factor n=1 Tax=Exilibacterium tricleocarpae TaxID=2591008 RepID=A0A545STD7_9GAMM|nr:response regulator transcription factor [Exilibacterium tricleocarpae]TQV68234.1 response regulator transcription factor [Exilibacterium tricleocarpae]